MTEMEMKSEDSDALGPDQLNSEKGKKGLKCVDIWKR